MEHIDLTGRILKSRYCILEQIGGGGEGSLYLARDMELGSLWAVKELPIARNREAKLLRLLSHPSLPKMIDYEEAGEFCYIIMEYIQGKSLEWYRKQGHPFSVEEILRMGIEITRVLEYLHTRKPPVYYGDLKPENLMLSDAGKLYLVDLGSAVFGYGKEQSLCLGTVGYAAPEQFEGQMGKESDVYALGRTMLALLGKRSRLLFLRELRLFFLIRKCCRRKENRRYPDMAAVRAALESVLKKRNKTGKGIWLVLVLVGVVLLLLAGKDYSSDFQTALTKATEGYYESSFVEGTQGEQLEICRQVENDLQELLRIYRKPEEQRQLLLLLAANSICQGADDRAKLYYEQLLLYEPEDPEIYGLYGTFLWEAGYETESRELWEQYQQIKEASAKPEEQDTDTDFSQYVDENLKLWEKYLENGTKTGSKEETYHE